MQQINYCECTFQDGGCPLYDEHNRCCMLSRIEIIVTDPVVMSYPWVKAGEEFV